MLFAILAGVFFLAAIIGLDIYFALDSVAGNTWSEMIRKLGSVLVFVPWAWGGLGGHFFHPNWKPALQSPNNFVVIIWLSVAVSIIGVSIMRSSWPYAHWVPYIVFSIAPLVIGKLWPV